MCQGDFVYNPANILFQAIKFYLCTQVRIHSRLDEYETKTEFKDRDDTFSKFD